MTESVTPEYVKSIATGGDVWLDPEEFERILNAIPAGYRFSSTAHEAENLRFQDTVFLKRKALA